MAAPAALSRKEKGAALIPSSIFPLELFPGESFRVLFGLCNFGLQPLLHILALMELWRLIQNVKQCVKHFIVGIMTFVRNRVQKHGLLGSRLWQRCREQCVSFVGPWMDDPSIFVIASEPI